MGSGEKRRTRMCLSPGAADTLCHVLATAVVVPANIKEEISGILTAWGMR